MYTISHVAEVLGVPAATLRAWQRRYEVVAPSRTDAGYRLYDEEDVATLRRMRHLIDEGWSPMQAAEAARAARPEGDGLPMEAGGPRVPAGGDLVSAAAALDGAAAGRMLEERLAYGAFEQVVDGWLLPQLERLGEAWASGKVSIVGEHLVAGSLQRRLSALYDLTGSTGRPCDVLTGLPSGCRHELGILCFAIASRRRGLGVAYLGPDLPDEDWRIAIERHRPRAAVLAVPTSVDVDPALRLVRQLAEAKILVGVGGRCQHQVRPGCGSYPADQVKWLGHDIGAAAARLAAGLGEGTSPPAQGGG